MATTGEGRGGPNRRDELISATLRLVGTRGTHSLTMREIAREAGMVVGSLGYHFEDRASLLLAALTTHIAATESIVDDGIFQSVMQRDITEPGGVHAALITLFTDRNDVLIRGELHLDAARSTAHQPLSARLTATLSRLMAAVHGHTGQSVDEPSVRAALADLQSVAVNTAATLHDPDDFAAAMTHHVAELVSVTPPGRQVGNGK